MEITFVRHTKTDVAPGTCYGQTDVGVADSFDTDATAVRDKLEGMRFDAVYCSPLKRCRMLASFCGYPHPLIDPRLMEMNFGEWEMKRYDDISGEDADRYYADYLNVAPPGGESFVEQRQRLESFLSDLSATGKERILIFTHGGIIMNAMLLAGLATPENLFSRQPAFGSITVIDFPSSTQGQKEI